MFLISLYIECIAQSLLFPFVQVSYMRIQKWQNNQFIDGGRVMVEVVLVPSPGKEGI